MKRNNEIRASQDDERLKESPASIEAYIAECREGIPTGIKFGNGYPGERLTLNAGLTFVCANTGHGTTSFLLNLAVNEATRLIHKNLDGSVLYFTYENDKRSLLIDLLGLYVNDSDLSCGKQPHDAITSYFKGDKRWIVRKHLDGFEQKKDEFFNDYLLSGRLIVVDEPLGVGALIDVIGNHIKTKGKPTLVCIDYAQLLFSENNYMTRTEEIKQIVTDINNFANREDMPFVLAAKFNRDVNSPVGVMTNNIGEGGDFERIADTCIGLFNLKALRPVGQSEMKAAKHILEKLGIKYNKGDQPLKPIEGELYVKLMKRRYGACPLDALLDWDGRTKHITLNDEEARHEIPEEKVQFCYPDIF